MLKTMTVKKRQIDQPKLTLLFDNMKNYKINTKLLILQINFVNQYEKNIFMK